MEPKPLPPKPQSVSLKQTADNEKMGPKAYAKFDKTFMAFGSIMNGLQAQLANKDTVQTQRIVDEAWRSAVIKVSDLVDVAYKNTNEEKPL